MTRRLLIAGVCALVAVPGARAQFAPVDQPGPPLTVPPSTLAAALICSPLVGRSDREPVLLVPGTGETFQAFYEWDYANELSNLGIPWCGVSPPLHQLGDTPIAGEYDVYAIRTLYRRSGNRRIAIVGHSQGGMQPRWALRFWPDTRAMVAADVGLAPDNQGSTAERQIVDACAPVGSCPVNFWQGATGSNFIQALNSRQEMFPGINYTVIYSTNDTLIEPQDTPLYGPGSYRRIALQDICPGHLATHLQDGSTDPISWALALDAITHPGPADPARIPRSLCTQSLMPGLTPTAAAIGGAQALAAIADGITTAPLSRTEPALSCYVYASCNGQDAPNLTLWKISRPRQIRAGQRAVIHVLVRADEGGSLVPVPGVTVTLDRYHSTTDDDGDTTIVARLARGRYSMTARRSGCNPAATTVRVSHGAGPRLGSVGDALA